MCGCDVLLAFKFFFILILFNTITHTNGWGTCYCRAMVNVILRQIRPRQTKETRKCYAELALREYCTTEIGHFLCLFLSAVMFNFYFLIDCVWGEGGAVALRDGSMVMLWETSGTRLCYCSYDLSQQSTTQIICRICVLKTHVDQHPHIMRSRISYTKILRNILGTSVYS